jgi:2-amino-4-hydroxy-6-hydroxymethyldihydropteridine diphosphokinase
MPRVGIALGSNLGDRLKIIQTARDLLKSIAVPDEPFLQGPVFLTEPFDCPPESPDFYNTVVEIAYEGSPFELLAMTQSFQRQLGRQELKQRNAPRPIDIDLIYFGNETIRSESLELPHPRYQQRDFVLQPLVKIRPDLVDGELGAPLKLVAADW